MILIIFALISLSFGAPNIRSDLVQKLSYGKVSVMLKFESTNLVLDKIHNTVFNSRGERAQAVYDSLNTHARNSQKEIIESLTTAGVEFESLWISNEINIPAASLDIINKLIKFPNILQITEEPLASIDYTTVHPNLIREQGIYDEWGIEAVNGKQACAAGKCGEGIRILIVDTGIRGTHEAVRDSQYEGFSWHDPDLRSTTPKDDNGHGTHVTGTILGTRGIGIATKAKWQGCVGCPENLLCPGTTLTKCAQFGICPHPPNRPEEIDCNQVSHVVSNSWYSYGGQGMTWFNSEIDAWRAADIVPVFCQGNDGSNGANGCGTANYPADYYKVIGVGSVALNGQPGSYEYIMSYFSSRGPTVVGQRIKPDVAAPGSMVYSAGHLTDTHYTTMSGTSMATPHVTGAVAILRSKNPSASYEEIMEALTSSANKSLILPTGQNCGGIPDNIYPNNNAGAGMLNCLAAHNALRSGVNISIDK